MRQTWLVRVVAYFGSLLGLLAKPFQGITIIAAISQNRKLRSEEPKAIMERSRWNAAGDCGIHIIPSSVTMALSTLNFSQIYAGNVGISNQNAQLNALQFAAMLHEVLIAVSVSSIMLRCIAYDLLYGEGIALFVKSGFWVDFNRSPGVNRYQILMSTYHSGIFTNAIAVFITSTSGPIFNLIIDPLDWVSRKIASSWEIVLPASLKDTRDFQEYFDTVLQTLPDRNGFTTIPLHVRIPAIPNGPPRGTSKVLNVLIAGLIAFGFPMALLIASIVSAGLATDSTAISASLKCGRYVYDPHLTKSSGSFLEYEHRAEAQSGLYASNCYGSAPSVDTCNNFYSQSIPYSTTNNTCPFNGEACLSMENNSMSFSTGLTSTSVLGINIPESIFFSRTTTCSPLVTGTGYIKKGVSYTGEEQWEYWYGASLADYTWANPVRQSAWEIKGYSTGVHCSEPNSRDSPFKPLPDFTAGSYAITMIFISSHNIMYSERRHDPIFPAMTEVPLPPDYRGSKLYFNNSTRAGVLGCVEQYKICETEAGPCWNNSNTTALLAGMPDENVTDKQLAMILVLLALDYSSTCGSVQFRGAEALDAQSKVAHMQSLPLATEQWRVEAEKWFQTSLARMQLNVFDIARGTAASFDGYEDTLFEQYRGICDMVKIPTVGWTNVNFFVSIGTIFAVGILWFIGWKWENEHKQKVLMAAKIWEAMIRPTCYFLAPYLKAILILLWKAVLECILEPLGDFLEILVSCRM